MIDFRDLRPSWEVGRNFKTRDDLRNLGCSETLIEWLNPNPDHWMLMVEPEDWFWRDRDWYPRADQGAVSELHGLSGGTFCAMSLHPQCEFLDLPLTVIEGRKDPAVRGRWQGAEGPVRVEDLALEYYRGLGYEGFAFEGKAYGAWLIAQQDFYRALFKRIPGFDLVDGRHVKEAPGPERAADYLRSLRLARENIASAYQKKKARFDKLWAPVTLESLNRFTDLLGWEVIERMHDLNFRLGATVAFGWPDLTLRKGDELRFVEVKADDRLRGGQAEWVRDVARPLGLNVSVTRVVPEPAS